MLQCRMSSVWVCVRWREVVAEKEVGGLFPGDITKYKTSQFKRNHNNKTFKTLIKVWTCDPLLWTTNLKFEISLYYKAINVNIYYYKMHKRLCNLYKWSNFKFQFREFWVVQIGNLKKTAHHHVFILTFL